MVFDVERGGYVDFDLGREDMEVGWESDWWVEWWDYRRGRRIAQGVSVIRVEITRYRVHFLWEVDGEWMRR